MKKPETDARGHLPERGCCAKNWALGAAVIALSGFVPLPEQQAQAASATANLVINAEIVCSLSIEATRPLSFGKLVAEGENGSLVIDPGGNVVSSENVADVEGFENGGLRFQGSAGVSYAIKASGLAGAGQTFGTAGGQAHLTLTRITVGSSPDGLKSAVVLQATGLGGDNEALFQLQGNGTAANNVGGGMTWQAAAPALGSYSGAIRIEVSRI